MAHITVNESLCKGCGLCVHYCKPRVLELAERLTVKGYHPAVLTDAGGCTGCAVCGQMCPDLAIEVYR